MLENILYSLSDILLVFGILFLFVSAVFRVSSQKFYFSFSKTIILLSAMFAVLFYNKNILGNYFHTSADTTLVFAITSALCLIWLYLTSKWHASSKESSSMRFCLLALCLLLSLKVMIYTTHLGILASSLTALVIFQGMLFHLSHKSEELYHISRRYIFVSFLFLSMLISVVFYFHGQNLQYENILEYWMFENKSLQILLTIGICCPLMYMVGAAPFHFWLTDQQSPAILPVTTYFLIVPVLAVWFVFLKINQILFAQYGSVFSDIYLTFGLLSVVCGMIGANTSRFIGKIFSSLSLYQTGIMLLILSTCRQNIASFGFIYMQTYIFVLIGICICFYAVKINGDYPNRLTLFAGLSSCRPFVAFAFVFLIFILTGLPPFSLFLTQFMMLMATPKTPLIIYIILLGTVMLIPVCFKMVQTVAFIPRTQNFDRVDFGLYVSLLLYMLAFIILSFKPSYFLLEQALLKDVL